MTTGSSPGQHEWIAVKPFQRPRSSAPIQGDEDALGSPDERVNPPSFDDSQFDVILRRQRDRPSEGGGLKLLNVPSRFLNLSNDFEFAGWGTVSRIKLETNDCVRGEEIVEEIRRDKTLGQFTATALAGNDLLGGIFYTLPAVFDLANIFSPICLLVATFILFLWRPVMEELVSALPLSGAPYTYLLNVSSKSFAVIGAVLLLLDFASTVVVSAATAASYLAGEVALPFPAFIITVLFVVFFMVISLWGMRESARLAFGVLLLHIMTMVMLIIAAAILWGRHGNDQLRANWNQRPATSPRVTARQIFDGICIGMLGLTGIECTPAYIAKIKNGRFPAVLRNLHIPAIALNMLISLLVLAVLPMGAILSGDNVLSLLAEKSAGRWLRVWIVVDAVIVLCGGILTGILSACELLEQLSRDRVVPQILRTTMPLTNSPFVAVLSFTGFSGIMYAGSGASLPIISKMFSLVWLTVMALFPVTLLILRFNRGRLPRQRRTSLRTVFLALVVCVTVFAGNIAIDPRTAGYFAAYFFGVLLLFSATQNKIALLRWLYWAYDQNMILQKWSRSRKWGSGLIKAMVRLRRQPVCILVKTDEINQLFHMLLYVTRNEETSCAKIVHFYHEDDEIPSELEANAKILDEAFPEITIDLVLVPGPFQPTRVAALSHRLQIPRSLMFMSCPGENFEYSISEFGTRIITL